MTSETLLNIYSFFSDFFIELFFLFFPQQTICEKGGETICDQEDVVLVKIIGNGEIETESPSLSSETKKFDPQNVDPRFIVAAPPKNMKLRKSRFRFGSFAFGHSAPTPAPPPPIHLPTPTFSVSTDPYFGHERLREESKFRSSSTASLVRRSNSRIDAIHSTTPVLLAVRKRSCSDSGLDEASGSSQVSVVIITFRRPNVTDLIL